MQYCLPPQHEENKVVLQTKNLPCTRWMNDDRFADTRRSQKQKEIKTRKIVSEHSKNVKSCDDSFHRTDFKTFLY